MAIGLQNQENITPPDSDYPDGQIKDNTGSGDGTPVNKKVYNDIHQFFAKLLRIAGITASNIPENEYSGFQYISALLNIITNSFVAGVRDSIGSGNIKTAIVNLGTWNMSSTVTILVPYPSGIDNSKIRRIDAYILSDDGTNNGPLYTTINSSDVAGNIQCLSSNIALSRGAGYFNPVNHSSILINRGYLYIEYIP